MRVQLITRTGHLIAEGKLSDKELENTTVLKYLGGYYMYAGMKKGVAQFREIRQPWCVTMVLK